MRRRYANDDDLIRATAQGDSVAFAELMRRHRRWVTRTLQAFTPNSDEAEDLTQDVFTRMYRHAAGYRVRGGFIAWLRRIAINTGSTYLHRRQPQALVPLSTLDETPAQGTDPLLMVLERSLEKEIQDAITGLPKDQRDALLMRCFLGLTVPEIARQQNCPEGTIKSRLSNGLKRVRALLTEKGEEGT